MRQKYIDRHTESIRNDNMENININYLENRVYTGRIYLRENTTVKRILKRHGNILYFAGHTHDSLVSDMPSIRTDRTVTYINTASVGNTEPCSKTVRSLKSFRDKAAYPQLREYFCRRSMGIRVEVYDSHYIVRGVDFAGNKYSPRCMAEIR